MKTYTLLDDVGRLAAFEIDNAWLQPRGIPHVLARLPGARLLPPSENGPDGERCRFEFDGTPFVVWEPFGDNSRYWIGPQAPGFTPVTAVVHGAFTQHAAARWFRALRWTAVGSLAVGLIAIILFRLTRLHEIVATIGVGAVVAGALGLLVLVTLAVLGATGSSAADRGKLADDKNHDG